MSAGFDNAVEVQHGFNPFAHGGEDMVYQSVSTSGGRRNDGVRRDLNQAQKLPAMPSSGFIVKVQVWTRPPCFCLGCWLPCLVCTFTWCGTYVARWSILYVSCADAAELLGRFAVILMSKILLGCVGCQSIGGPLSLHRSSFCLHSFEGVVG